MPGSTSPLHVLLCTGYIRETLSPQKPLLGCWPLSFEPELSHSDDPYPEPAELPSECPYGEGDIYYGFQKSPLVAVPISLDTASQRAQAPLEWPAHVIFPLPQTFPTQGPWTAQCCWHLWCNKWPGCASFSCCSGGPGRSRGGWR